MYNEITMAPAVHTTHYRLDHMHLLPDGRKAGVVHTVLSLAFKQQNWRDKTCDTFMQHLGRFM